MFLPKRPESVQFTPDMQDMKVRTWCLETIPFELSKSNSLREARNMNQSYVNESKIRK